MKTSKILTVALLGLVTMAFTACNSDNDVRTLTKQEIAQCFNTVRGSYNGELIYKSENKNNPRDVTDTVAIKWTIGTDSTLVIEQFPSKVLALNVTNTELKQALEAGPNQDVKCRIGFIETSPVGFLINPSAPSFDLNYGGKVHKVQVAFMGNNYSSFGQYTTAKKTLVMQIIEGAIFVDNNRTEFLKQPIGFVLQAKK